MAARTKPHARGQKIFVPAHVLRSKEPLSISFHIAEPRTPAPVEMVG